MPKRFKEGENKLWREVGLPVTVGNRTVHKEVEPSRRADVKSGR